MARNPRDVSAQVIFPSAAMTTTTTSQIMAVDPTLWSGMMFIMNISAVTGTTPSMTVKVQYVDPISGTAIDVPSGAFAAKTATGIDTLLIHLASTASANRVVAQPLVGYYQVVATISGTTPSFTWSLAGVPVH